LKLYGIASRQSGDIDDWSLSREEAEEKLRQALADEPERADALYVAEVEVESDATDACLRGIVVLVAVRWSCSARSVA
jgi:hypothetical protein